MKFKLMPFLFTFCFVLFLSPSVVNAERIWVDVDETNAYYKEIKYLYDRGIVDNSTSGFYGIDGEATRVRVIVMIGKALGLDGTQRNTIFSDVPKGNYASGYIQSAVDAGIISGYSDGTFRPFEALNRGHMATFLERAYREYLPQGSKEFIDVPSNHTAYNAIKKLEAAGIIAGYPDGTFKPNTKLSTAHLTVFMYRTVKYVESKKEGSPNNQNGINNSSGNSNNVIDDSKIKLGMSYKEVYDLVEHRITFSIDSVIYTNISRNNLDGKTNYYFENGNLNSIKHIYDIGNEPFKVSEKHNYYIESLIPEFGDDYVTIQSGTTPTNYTISTLWELSDKSVLLTTRRIDNNLTIDSFISKK